MPVAFGPVRYAIFPLSAADVSVTTLGGQSAVLTTPIAVDAFGFITFTVAEPGIYRITIRRNSIGISELVVLESSNAGSGHSSGTVYDYIDDQDFVRTVNNIAPDDAGNVNVTGGSGGTTDHTALTNRSAADQHPTSAITGLDTALASKAPIVSPTFTGTVSGVSKSMVGLGSVDDTADSAKPVSAAQQTAIDAAKLRSNHTGTQPSTTISDFTEAVQDAVAALLGAGSNITLNYDDAGNTLTVTSSGGGVTDPEAVRDAIGAALIGVSPISVVVNDAADTITISTTATVNDTNANLRDRSTHTGAQAISTITGLQGELDAKAPINSPTFTGTVSGVSKAMVGLGSVDDTADADKPLSTAASSAISAKLTTTLSRPVLRPTSSSANLNRSGAPAGYTGPVEFDTTAYSPYTGTISGQLAGDWLSDRP